MAKHIVLIGPTASHFKGGIVHYTHCLANALADHAAVTVISFSRSYPKFLYKQKQETEVFYEKKYEEFPLIDWANPLSWFHANKVIKQLNPDLFILQWWTAFWAVPLLALTPPHIRTIGIVHNISDHEKIPFSKELGTAVLKRCSVLVTHASSLKTELQNRFNVRVLLQLHPTHTMFHAISKSKQTNPTLLFFGHVRPYKGLDVLLTALPRVREHLPTIHLTIVGEFWGNEKETTLQRIQELSLEDSVSITDRYVPDEEVPRFFSEADALVMPYRHATGTAVSKIALATRTPLIATAVGDIPDLFRMGTIGRVVKPNDPPALANAIVSFFSENTDFYQSEIERVASELTWDSFAVKLTKL